MEWIAWFSVWYGFLIFSCLPFRNHDAASEEPNCSNLWARVCFLSMRFGCRLRLLKISLSFLNFTLHFLLRPNVSYKLTKSNFWLPAWPPKKGAQEMFNYLTLSCSYLQNSYLQDIWSIDYCFILKVCVCVCPRYVCVGSAQLGGSLRTTRTYILYKARNLFCTSIYFKHLEECLAHNRYSINICLMNECLLAILI